MPHSYRFGIVLVAALAVQAATMYPVAAQDSEPRLNLVELDGYRLTAETSGHLPGLFGSPLDWSIYRSTGPFGDLTSSGSAASVLPGAAQQEPPDDWGTEQPTYGQSGDLYLDQGSPISQEISLGVYGAAVVGTAIDWGGGVVDDTDYSEFFDVGTGVRLSWRLHLIRDSGMGRSFSWGPMALFEYVSFPGDVFTDDLGETLEPDEMLITKYMVGVHIRNNIRGFFFGAHFTIGLAIIDTVDGTWDRSATGNGIWDVEIYSQTSTIGIDLELRLGAMWGFGPSPVGMAAYGFFGYGWNDAPDEGDNFSFEPGSMGTGYVGVGVSIEFGGVDDAGAATYPP